MDKTKTADKWKKWLGFDQTPRIGMQGRFEGGEYCDRGAWRASDESVMNMLWDSSDFNSISRENAVRVLDKVRPDISARAYDDIDWVRGDRAELEQTVSWEVQVP